MDDFHQSAVQNIRNDVRRFYETRKKFRIYHGSTNSTRHADFDRDAIVDVSMLDRVLHVDPSKGTVLVEPNVPMDLLIQETKKAGFLPPVVMEFPGITVGGGFVGTAGESSSFKYGFFDRTVVSTELVLADGTLITASEKENLDLFNGLAGSFGTLGVLTLVEIRLIEYKKYVELTYHPVVSIEESISKLKEETLRDENDYVDGILFAGNKGSIVTGRLTDFCPNLNLIQRFARAWDPWFYIHAQFRSSTKPPAMDIVPTEDYLFRYDRGAFWTGMYAFRYFMMPFNRLTRFILDYFMHTRVMYHALHASRHTDRYIIQDLALPVSKASAFINWIDERFGFYPLWLCPLPPNTRGSMAHPYGLGKIDQYINIGVWGPYASSYNDFVKANRDIERKVREFGGLKWLYARAFYTEEEFWQIYDEHNYMALRGMYGRGKRLVYVARSKCHLGGVIFTKFVPRLLEKYAATTLPTVFEKVCEKFDQEKEADYGPGLKGRVKRVVLSTTFTRGIYGIWKAIRGGDYLLAEENGSERIIPT